MTNSNLTYRFSLTTLFQGYSTTDSCLLTGTREEVEAEARKQLTEKFSRKVTGSWNDKGDSWAGELTTDDVDWYWDLCLIR